MKSIKSLFYIFLNLIFISSHSHASADAAKMFVEKVSKDALGIITSQAPNKEKEDKLSQLFIESVDTKWIAKFAMGAYWREASEEQRKLYVENHRIFLLSGYIPKFKEYNNQEIKINKSYEESNNEYMVETQIIGKDGTAINVNYKIHKDNGKFMVFDILAEGVSLITTQRSDFASILSRQGGIDELIKMLGNKA